MKCGFCSTSYGGRLIADGIIFLVVILVSDFGMITEADGVIVAALVATLRPKLLPYLVILVAGFQDAKGLSGFWWYGGTAVLGIWVILKWHPRLIEVIRNSTYAFRSLLVLALIIVVYTVSTSYLLDVLGTRPQAASREPYVVGALDMLMCIIGATCYVSMRDDATAVRRLQVLGALMFCNGAAISVARMVLGYDHFLSTAGIIQLDDAQLVEDTPLGFPRLTGTYLTPIGYAMYFAYILILWEAMTGNGKRISGWFILLYGIIGAILATMSLSKGIAIYFMFTFFVMLMARPKYLFTICLSLIPIVLWLVTSVGVDAISTAFRIEQGTSDTSYRAIAWTATISNFNWSDWMFGTGFAYWPNFFEKHAGFALSDPHNYLLSVPGTYGMLGVVFYFLLAYCLIRGYRKSNGLVSTAALSFLVMFFVADVVSIPYVIGNTPITACIWMGLSALCMSPNNLKEPHALSSLSEESSEKCRIDS